MSENKEKNCRLGVVGGSAVLEGVMMKHGDRYSLAVRTPDGSIAVEDGEFVSKRKKYKILGMPFIRGVVNMVESLVLSTKVLERSAILAGVDEEEEKKEQERTGKKTNWNFVFGVVTVISLILGLALSMALFVFLPQFLTKTLERLIGQDLGLWKNVIEGCVKILIFIGYLSVVLLMKDIRTTFRYHGAEHKTIFCYEAGVELTPENVKSFKRFHPRCGTSFMFIIILISIAISFLPIFNWDAPLQRFLIKLAILPVTVGVSFECIRLAGKHENFLTRILSAPGLWVQRITTKEPTLEQIEVAIHALKSSMPEEFPDSVKPVSKAAEAEVTPETVAEETVAEEVTAVTEPSEEQ